MCGQWFIDCECPANNKPYKSAVDELEEAIKIRAKWDKEQELKEKGNEN